MLNKKQLYSDIPFFLSKNPFTRDINLVKGVNAIKQSVKNIVLTARREKPFNFLFGGNPRDFLFENINSERLLECKYRIANTLNTFESRIVVREIFVTPNVLDPNQVDIMVVYNILSTGVVDFIVISLERTR